MWRSIMGSRRDAQPKKSVNLTVSSLPNPSSGEQMTGVLWAEF